MPSSSGAKALSNKKSRQGGLHPASVLRQGSLFPQGEPFFCPLPADAAPASATGATSGACIRSRIACAWSDIGRGHRVIRPRRSGGHNTGARTQHGDAANGGQQLDDFHNGTSSNGYPRRGPYPRPVSGAVGPLPDHLSPGRLHQLGLEISLNASPAGFSPRRSTATSPSATIPTRRFSLLTTGNRRIWCSLMRLAAFSMESLS